MSVALDTKLIHSFSGVYIHRDVINEDVSQRIISIFKETDIPIKIVEQKPYPEKKGHLSAKEFEASKKLIYVTKHRGAFFKRCPGAKPGLTCCNYFVLNLGLQCNMNCSYCYLQSYLNTPMLTIYANIDDALNELNNMATEHSELFYRVGTGETIDSLSLDPITGYSKKLIQFFKKYPKWQLELKTKSNYVEQFLNEPHARNVLVSWSINPSYIVNKEEHGTAKLNERLQAAKKCLSKGFRVAFHIDPMIWHKDWEKNYSELVDQITRQFDPKDIEFITVGSLRFQPEQRFLMKERFGLNSLTNQAEVFKSKDGKLRYDQEVRSNMFKKITSLFKMHNKNWKISLCMEVPETWSTTMASSPRKVPEIKNLFSPLPKIQKTKESPTLSKF